MNDTIEETEEEAAARVREWRGKKALGQASELVAHIRRLMLHTDGRSERGVVFPVESTPLHTEKADDADSVYAQLVNWVTFWSEELEVMAPSTAWVAWSNFREVQGFKAGTTPGGAQMLVRILTMWLLGLTDRIAAHDSGAVFFEDVTQIIWSLRAKYPTTAGPERDVRPGVCPMCGERAVEAVWASTELLDVEIACGYCGHVVPAPKPSDILRWLNSDAGFALACTQCGEEFRAGSELESRADVQIRFDRHMVSEHAEPGAKLPLFEVVNPLTGLSVQSGRVFASEVEAWGQVTKWQDAEGRGSRRFSRALLEVVTVERFDPDRVLRATDGNN